MEAAGEAAARLIQGLLSRPGTPDGMSVSPAR
jgi:hypothetical protein